MVLSGPCAGRRPVNSVFACALRRMTYWARPRPGTFQLKGTALGVQLKKLSL